MADPELDNLSGSELRKKYEEALGEVKKLSKENLTFKAASLIGEKQFTLVKPEDLAGVDPDKLEAEAQRIHSERRDQQKEIVKDLFARQGYEEDELETLVDEYMEGKVPSVVSDGTKTARGLESVRALERLDARPVGSAEDFSKMTPMQQMEHGLAKNAKKRS